MNRYGIAFLTSTIIVFFTCITAYAFHAEISPSEIKPGDAFVIKVNSAKTSRLPNASLKGRRFYFSNCGEGCFVSVGSAGMRTRPGVYTIKLRVGKKIKNLHLVVTKTSSPTLVLTLPYDEVFLSKENLRRAKREKKKLKTIFQKVSKRLWEGSFVLPLENDVSTPFGTKRILNKKWISIHRGVDVTGQDGEEVKASNSGRVVLADELFYGGNTVILDHGQGIYTTYMHLSNFNVSVRDMVSKGDIIGFVGSSGRSTEPHLHFGVNVMNVSTNPVSLIELNL